MDPKSTRKPTIPAACHDRNDPQAEIWEPPFERWQRLTEALISNADGISDGLTSVRKPPRV
jgi:hypothetical protein